jgi:hypothetical protein
MWSIGRRSVAIATLCALLSSAGRALADSRPPLGSAASFAVLGGTAVTNSGTTRIVGNVGVSPRKTVRGFPAGAVTVGDIHGDDALARQAQRDVAAVSQALSNRTCLAAGVLGGEVPPGAYCAPGVLSGTLTLDAAANADAVWIFRLSSLTTTADTTVALLNGARDRNVFWQVDGAVTLGERTAFAGNIIAATSITLSHGATLAGRALAQTGAVTLAANRISSCCEPIAVNTSFSAPAVGFVYRQQLDASGGTGEYTFAIVAGALPRGLTLSDGAVTGTPTASGTYAFTAMATDTHGCSGARAYTVDVAAAHVVGQGLDTLTDPVAAMLVILLAMTGYVALRRSWS